MWKTCGRHVQILWTTGQCIFLSCAIAAVHRRSCLWTPPSRPASLDRSGQRRRINPLIPGPKKSIVTVHRFEETIGGRAYHIEVTLVSNRWRAQLRRMPGMPTAMMPFYGQTPDEAARLLVQWLTLAHRRCVVTVTKAPVAT
jgi:hypothetical protein